MKHSLLKQTFIMKIGISENVCARIKCPGMEWYWSYVRSWGFDFNKSNILENANSYMLEILISEYQIAFPPEAEMWHFGMKQFSSGELDTSLYLSCAIRSYQIQMCIRPELNPQQKHMTVMISLHIVPYWVFWYLFFGWDNETGSSR